MKSLKITVLLLLAATACLFSCSDKKEYDMELAFQKQMAARSMYENERLLKRIEKEVADNGRREKEVVILDRAAHIIDVRNKNLSSMKSVPILVENIKPIVEQAGKEERHLLNLLNFYQEKLKQQDDSLMFQKFLNVYLIFEKRALDEILSQMSGSCNWGIGLTPHVLKTIDTISLGLSYELEVVPEIFNYKETYISDTCNIAIYKNNVPVEMKYAVVRKGFVYLISVIPAESGNYKIRGTFTQYSSNHAYVVENVFTDTFVVTR